MKFPRFLISHCQDENSTKYSNFTQQLTKSVFILRNSYLDNVISKTDEVLCMKRFYRALHVYNVSGPHTKITLFSKTIAVEEFSKSHYPNQISTRTETLLEFASLVNIYIWTKREG